MIITGTIRDKVTKRNALAGIRVQIIDEANPSQGVLDLGVTDRDGNYRLMVSLPDELTPRSLLVQVLRSADELIEEKVVTIDRATSRSMRVDWFVEERRTSGRVREVVNKRVSIAPRKLVIRQENGFDVPYLTGFDSTTLSGRPTLLQQVHYVLLPKGSRIIGLSAEPGRSIVVGERMNPKPVAPARLDVPDTNPVLRQRHMTSIQQPVRMKPGLLENVPIYPLELATISSQTEFGDALALAITVQPMQFDSRKRQFLLYPDLNYTLEYERPADSTDQPRNTTRSLSIAGQPELMRLLTANPRVTLVGDVFRNKHWFPVFKRINAPYVIITDDTFWTSAPGAATPATKKGAMPADAKGLTVSQQFMRLAEWKTARGVEAKVVTVSEILAGKSSTGTAWANFTDCGSGLKARDLEEVIRNFIKYAYRNWNTRYVLLGGDVSVIPMRQMMAYVSDGGNMGWDFVYTGDAVPAQRKAFQTTSKTLAKLRYDPGLPAIPTKWVDNPDKPETKKLVLDGSKPMPVLCNATTGTLISYNPAASAGQPGWYFTTQQEFTNAQKMGDFKRIDPVEVNSPEEIYLIVEGPAASLSSSYGFYWIADDRKLYTDFYYASLEGSCYSVPGRHDFDPLSTGLYGQFALNPTTLTEEPLLNGFKVSQDVWVGRAPVTRAAEAGAFVDKVIAYESLTFPDASPSFGLLSMAFAADYWYAKGYSLDSSAKDVPAFAGNYSVEKQTSPSSDSVRIRIMMDYDPALAALSQPNFTLKAVYADHDTVVPYNPLSQTETPRFYFKDQKFAGKVVDKATRYLEVTGLTSQSLPQHFITETVGLEAGAFQKEQLIAQMSQQFPDFKFIQRFYADYLDLGTVNPPVKPLRTNLLQEGIGKGVHFLSLTGHGYGGGCSGLNVDTIDELTNQAMYFIGFGNSCSTSDPAWNEHSFGEKMVLMPNKGAVAYVGNTGMSGTEGSNKYEEFFWQMLACSGRLGQAAGMRRASDGHYSQWNSYIQTLYGDPEMPVWRSIYKTYMVKHALTVKRGATLTVSVQNGQLQPVVGHTVTLLSQWSNEGAALYRKAQTNADGQVTFTVPMGAPVGKTLLTVSGEGFKPYRAAVDIQ